MGLQQAIARLMPLIETDLRRAVQVPEGSLAAYFGAMHYHLGWADEKLQPAQSNAGKRLRPLLCLLACEAVGGDPQQALPAATALELVHNFSLVHDDIQDGSHTRRGRRTVWDIWGAAHGINIGDGILVLARLSLHRLAAARVPLPRCHTAIAALDGACLSLCEGQFLDMTFESQPDPGLDQVLAMVRHKTAALLAASAQLGAIVATEDPICIGALFRFGENLGMAFQIQDDILGIWGDEQVTGKSAATDIRDRKKTVPVVYSLHHAPQLAALYRGAHSLGDAEVQSILAILEQVGARQAAKAMAEGYSQQALRCLEESGISPTAQQPLRELAAFLLKREA